jgi:hypothetical protein
MQRRQRRYYNVRLQRTLKLRLMPKRRLKRRLKN